MEEVESKKKNNTKKITILVVFLAVFAAVILLLVNLFNEKITVTTGGSEVTSSSSLYCTTKSKNIPDTFFDLSTADTADQAIKVLFKNNKIDNIAYNATATYQDPDVAKNTHATLYAGYGKYIQDAGRSMDVFSPNFSVSGNEVKISLYSDYKQLDSKTAKIFLIDTSETNLDSYTTKVLSTLYKTKGFSCESSDKK
ncbi:hypothetical protein IJG27_02925 [Candidatus Saccharibacteria bacterium]|nr:hypothetical protein [Candidatus Saccharibacteria bacterium]MBQ6461124.1 hypothetical protein [Candidatus Saccharibacteria bacterium]